MIVANTVAQVRRIRQDAGASSWGLVPTMGYLHDGHLSLVRRARVENERVAVSIYVNPTQFAPDEDLDTYPRDLKRDLELLRAERVDLLFAPDDAVMYPSGFQTTVAVAELTRKLEGRSRPTHFQGVTTVVAKLVNILQPTRAYFGQKDAQQAAVIRRLVIDLCFPLEVVVCPIVREEDGLAMSSRNRRLTATQRPAATVLFRALSAAVNAFSDGQRDAAALRTLMSDLVATEPEAELDYVSVADPTTLDELDVLEGSALLSLAVYVGDTRLIDNMLLDQAT